MIFSRSGSAVKIPYLALAIFGAILLFAATASATNSQRVPDPGRCLISTVRATCVVYNAKNALHLRLRTFLKVPGADPEIYPCRRVASLRVRCSWRYQAVNPPLAVRSGTALVVYRQTAKGWIRSIAFSAVICRPDEQYPQGCSS